MAYISLQIYQQAFLKCLKLLLKFHLPFKDYFLNLMPLIHLTKWNNNPFIACHIQTVFRYLRLSHS